MRLELSEPQADYLRTVLAEEIDRAEDHLDWLRSDAAKDEEDRERQTGECETAITQGKALLALLGEQA